MFRERRLHVPGNRDWRYEAPAWAWRGGRRHHSALARHRGPGRGERGHPRQIVAAVPELLAKTNFDRGSLRGIGIGFGGPTDDATQTVIKSHQITGWDGFPLADWVSDLLDGLPVVLCNDADVAGLAEALFGAGKGVSPVFYITVGTGVGGGLIIDEQIYRGVGRGAAEIGHLRLPNDANHVVEDLASGPGIERTAAMPPRHQADSEAIRRHCGEGPLTAKGVVAAAKEGNRHARWAIEIATSALADGICNALPFCVPGES